MTQSTLTRSFFACIALTVSACSSASSEDSASSADAIVGPEQPTVSARWNASGSPASSLEQVITVSRGGSEALNTLEYTLEFGTEDGPRTGAYRGRIGLRSFGSVRSAVFAWRGATAAESAGLIIDKVEGESGRSTYLSYGWVEGRAYRLVVERASQPEAVIAKAWNGSIVDTTTGEKTLIGEIVLPAGSRGLAGASVSSVEYRGARKSSCAGYPSVDASFLAPRFDGRPASYYAENRTGGSCPAAVDDAKLFGIDVARLTLGAR